MFLQDPNPPAGARTRRRRGRSSRSCEVGQPLCSAEQGAERVALLGQTVQHSADGPSVGSELRVVELVPGDRHRDRCTGRRPGRVRRHECLVDRVLGVVESGEPPAGLAPPTSSSPARARPCRLSGRAASPSRGCRRRSSRARSAPRSGCLGDLSPSARAVTPRWSSAVRCSRASTSRVVPAGLLPGVQVDQRVGRLVGRSARDVHGCHSSAPKFAAQTSAAGSSTTTYVVVSPSSASGLSQAPSQSGAWSGRCLCQKPLPSGAVGIPVQVERPPLQVGQRDGCDARGVGEQFALGHRWVPRRREQHLVEICDLQSPAEHLPGSLLPERLQLVDRRIGQRFRQQRDVRLGGRSVRTP